MPTETEVRDKARQMNAELQLLIDKYMKDKCEPLQNVQGIMILRFAKDDRIMLTMLGNVCIESAIEGLGNLLPEMDKLEIKGSNPNDDKETIPRYLA